MVMPKSDAGKGSVYRQVSKQYYKNAEKLFGTTSNIWPRNEDGELIEPCPHCGGKGYLEYIGLKRKPIKIKCMFCEKGFIKSEV